MSESFVKAILKQKYTSKKQKNNKSKLKSFIEKNKESRRLNRRRDKRQIYLKSEIR